jgi:hypothetical protein
MDVNKSFILSIKDFVRINNVKVRLLCQLSFVRFNLLLQATNLVNSCKHLILISKFFRALSLLVITNCGCSYAIT